jgi:uncharacterized protein (TIGR02145 family)
MKKIVRIRPYILMVAGFMIVLTGSCKKEANKPSLQTAAISNISQTSAQSGGEIISDGGAKITGCGVCWSANHTTPALSDSISRDSLGTGSFKSILIGLIPNTTYYVRAYATNSSGTEYGNTLQLVTKDFGKVTDIDGNVYYTVTLGTQEWMVENLKVTHYRNGDPIPNVTNDSAWSILTTGAWCEYNNQAVNGVTYGKLYNWYALEDSRNIAPSGWHLPTNADWSGLMDYLSFNGYGFATNINEIAKSIASQSGWQTDGTPGTVGNDQRSNNKSGLSALPGGYRYIDGTFKYNKSYCFWWTSTDISSDVAWYYYLNSFSSFNFNDFTIKSLGMSVRCVKD